MSKRILILAGGPVRKLDNFVTAGEGINVNLVCASLSEINYETDRREYRLRVGKRDIASFDIIYFRVVGKRIEDAALVAGYAKARGIRVVDRLYSDSLVYPSSLSKAVETAKLIKAAIPLPKTIYGSLAYLSNVAPKEFEYPFIIKSTTGKKAREVWIVGEEIELTNLLNELRKKEKEGARFFAQEFVKASMRYRVFVLGGEIVATLAQLTKWRKRFNTEELEKGLVSEPTSEMKALAIQATDAAGLDISGVDILRIDGTGELLIIEANAAPSWRLVEKYTGKNMAEEILKWLIRQK
jgi:RimK family alpha-L-glutamate ligase